MGLGSSIKKGLKSIGKALGSVVGAVFGAVSSLLNSLIDIPKPPKNIETGRQYDVDARVNSSQLGDVKTVIYGRARDWPSYASVPYTEFEGHDQIFSAYLFITVGYADILDIKIGDTAANRFPGFEFELLAPGDDLTLVLPNVYSCPEVSNGVELLGGALDRTDTDGIVTVKFSESGETTIIAGPGPFQGSFTSDTDGAFADFVVADRIYVYEAGDNDGEYVITSIGSDFKNITVFPSPAENATQNTIVFFVRQRWAGPYPACPPGSVVDQIAVDLVFSSLRDNEADENARSVEMVVEYRPIDDVGNVIDPTWQLATDGEVVDVSVTHTDNVNRPRRYTDVFTLSEPMRCEVRVWRKTYEQNDSEDPSSAAQWVNLKGYIVAKIADTPNSDPECTRLAIRIRSSGQLSVQSQRAVNVLVQRLLPIYNGSVWSAPQATRNAVWAHMDWLTSQSNGAITYDDNDLEAVLELATFADDNDDTFDGVFDRQVGLWEGSQTLLRVVRAKPIFDPLLRLFSVYRDEPSDPVTLFCDSFNCRVGTDSIALPDNDTVTGIQVRFTDPVLWAQREGPMVGVDDDPRIVEFMGCTTWAKAWIEAQYEYRDLYYRNHSCEMRTEMEGLLPRHGKRVLVASSIKGWGQAGEVRDVEDLTIRVWPAPIWQSGVQHYVYLQDDQGAPVGPINVEQGIEPQYLVLEALPSPFSSFRIGAGWRTLFAFGHDGDEGDLPANAPRVAIVQKRSPDGFREARLDLLFDNPFVHEDPGPAPPDPYSLDGTMPDLIVENLTASVIYADAILDEDGNPILDENGEAILEEGGIAFGAVVFADWDDVAGATYYQLRWKYVGDPGWHVGYTGIASEATFGVTQNGTVQVRVKAISTTFVGPESTTTVPVIGFP